VSSLTVTSICLGRMQSTPLEHFLNDAPDVLGLGVYGHDL
jgi:hypothetical protein